ncbi:hypothetical protein PAMC26510_32805 [Caballeronia sordidicola]|uniref:Uncharacterized protein n=1 Tax=Caballeronia sordidicola TaxID=196367 RepID=A0A242M8K4_CABSO|nr:hypothetical protein PAMC26510_32805 [Caballeronia sordidicola]
MGGSVRFLYIGLSLVDRSPPFTIRRMRAESMKLLWIAVAHHAIAR